MPHKWDLADLPKAVQQSKSIRQVLVALGLKPAGGNYTHVKQLIIEHGLDTSHFKGQGWNKGLKMGPRKSIFEFFDNSYKISSFKLKNRLLREGFFDHACMKCGSTEWNGEPIPLELEHRDGDHSNNNFENLELLCPNCHAQTDTYRGKNIRRAA